MNCSVMVRASASFQFNSKNVFHNSISISSLQAPSLETVMIFARSVGASGTSLVGPCLEVPFQFSTFSAALNVSVGTEIYFSEVI